MIMNKNTTTPALLLFSLALMVGTSACEAKEGFKAGYNPTTSTTTALPATTTTTPTPDLKGNYCWTERNLEAPDGVEGLCSKDLSKVPTNEVFLHWGMPKEADYIRTEANAKPDPTCQEDDPCWDADTMGDRTYGSSWDCHTMGDKICQTRPS